MEAKEVFPEIEIEPSIEQLVQMLEKVSSRRSAEIACLKFLGRETEDLVCNYKKLKPKHNEIITKIVRFLASFPEFRFGQVMYALRIIGFSLDVDKNYNPIPLDIFNDSDEKILKRML